MKKVMLGFSVGMLLFAKFAENIHKYAVFFQAP